jgi:hypothetical protein
LAGLGSLVPAPLSRPGAANRGRLRLGWSDRFASSQPARDEPHAVAGGRHVGTPIVDS